MKLLKFVIFIIVVMASVISICAHSTSQSGIIDCLSSSMVGSEEIGWIIIESNHTDGDELFYKYKAGPFELTNDMKNAFESATVTWSRVVNIEAAGDENIRYGTIRRMLSNHQGIGASFRDWETDSSGHLTSWIIEVNGYCWSDYTSDEKVALLSHELGHAIGLYDLYEEQNYNKIMCGNDVYCTVYSPTTHDIYGALVITGQHTTHQWTKTAANHRCRTCYGIGSHTPARGCTYSLGTSSGHTGYCPVCSYSFTESHSKYYNSATDRCTACGYSGANVME